MRKLIIYITAILLSLSLQAQSSGYTDLYLRAVAEFSEGSYSQASEKFKALLAVNPKDDASNYYLGLCEFASKDVDKAEFHLSTAASIDTTNEWYTHALALLYNAKGDKINAALLLEKLVKKIPAMYNNPYNLTLIADANLAQMRDSLALSYYNQALELDPSYAPAELGKVDVLRIMGNFPAFFNALDHFVRSEYVPPVAKSDYLTALMDNIDSRFYWVWGEQINKEVDILNDLHPDDIKGQMLKLRMCYIKKDMDGVLKQCEVLETLATQQSDTKTLAEVYSIEGDVYHSLGDMKKTFAAYDKALDVDPELTTVLNNYAYYLSLSGKSLRKALKMSQITIEKEPDNATYLDTYGWLLFQLKRPKEAKPYFKHAIIYGGKESSVILEHYSKVLEALGEESLSSYYKSLSEQKRSKDEN